MILLISTTNLIVNTLPMPINKNAVAQKQEENKENSPRELKAKIEYDTYMILYYKKMCTYLRGFKNNYRKRISYIIQKPNKNKLKADKMLIISKSYGIEIHFNEPVINLEYFFSRAYDENMAYLASIDFSHFDSSLVTNTRSMFSGCCSLDSISLSNFNTSLITDMTYMFSDCSSLKSISLINLKTSKLLDMNSMFSGCSSLKSINLSNSMLHQ